MKINTLREKNERAAGQTPAPLAGRVSRDQAAPRGGRQRSAAKAVVVHSGARDGYQVALALDQAGQLASLVTDLYWPADRPWARRLLPLLPASLRAQLLQRTAPGLNARHVRPLTLRGLATLVLDKLPRAPFGWRRSLMRQTDAALGRAAGRRARQTGATLVSYSYYGYHAFAESRAPGHPLPAPPPPRDHAADSYSRARSAPGLCRVA